MVFKRRKRVPKKGKRKFANKKKFRGKRKFSKFVTKGQNQLMIYHPHCPQDVFPSEIITTMYFKFRVRWPASNITGGANNPLYFTVRGCNPNLPLNASGNGGGNQFQQIVTGAGAGLAVMDGGFTISDQCSGWQRLSAMYESYQVIGSRIKIVPSCASTTDTVKIYCYPVVCASQGTATTPATNENLLDEVKGIKSAIFNINSSNLKGQHGGLVNKALSYQVLGYTDLKSHLADYTGTGWSVTNPNTIPYNVWNWVVLYTMTDGAANGSSLTFDIEVQYRVKWGQLIYMT